MEQLVGWWQGQGHRVIELMLLGLLLNLPFGFLRAGTRRFSAPWFLYVHVPIPFLFLLRHLLELNAWAILYSLAAAVLGQVFGGKLRNFRDPQETGPSNR
ncbi:MAG: hypothetical protein HY318_06420 [Armatimonadetes bacterium]|nr:hypothetical protein [Armatimonadota bacterium]